MLGKDDISYNLISAVRKGRLKNARELIKLYGLSYSQAWSEGYVLLCEALENKHPEVAKLLLTSGSKVNNQNKILSDTPLHFAAINGYIEVVKMILEKGANIDAKNLYGRTPLHNAIENKKLQVTALLLRHRAAVNAHDNDGTTPLHVAAKNGCLQTVRHLLKCKASVNRVCIQKYKKGFTPLHFAVEKGSEEVVTLLLSSGANVDVQDEDGITPLHIAAKKGYTHIAEDLLNYGARTYSLTLKERYIPLHFATELGNIEVVRLFLNRGGGVNVATKGNLTPLHIATKIGHKTIIKLLLQHGAKVDNQDKDGRTVLHFAVKRGFLKIVEDLLKYCPDINNESNRNSLKTAVYGYGEEYKEIVEALLEYGFIVNPEDVNDFKLVHAAVEKGYLKIVEDLLKYGADINMLNNSMFGGGFTLLHCAVENKQEEVAKLLINYEADINAEDQIGKTPIFYAIENADLKITKLLLTNGANVKDNPELLNNAVKEECLEIVEALLQHDIDVNASDKYGRTALHFTALDRKKIIFGSFINEITDINSKGEIAKLLLSKGVNADAQTKNDLTTLHIASQKGYAKVVEALLEYNANVNIRTSNITPLNLSAEIGNEEISTMPLNKGDNVNAEQKVGITALHIATKKGHKEVVKILLECGAKVDSKIKWDITPLHLGAQEGYQEIIKIILKFDADIDSRDEYGRTALHMASKMGHANVVTTLLDHGSDINITTKKDYTPLDYAMAGIRSFYRNLNYESDDHYFSHHDRVVCSCEEVAKALKRHLIKIKTSNFYVSEKNLLSMNGKIDIKKFQDECEKEIASMKIEMIKNTNISIYNILAKGTRSLAVYMRNEDIVKALKSDDYKKKFPIYANMIESHFRKGMERKFLLEQGNIIFLFLFSDFFKLQHNCTEKIFSYLTNEDIRNLMDACKSLNIRGLNTNINDFLN